MQRKNIDVREIVEEWKKRVKGPVICELCGGTRWVGFSPVSMPTTPSGAPLGSTIVGGPFLPLLQMACAICGNTKFLNLVVLGYLLPGDGQEVGPGATMPADDLLRRTLEEGNGPITSM